MKGLLELLSVLSLLICLGALCWLGFSVIGTSSEYGDGVLMSWERSSGPLTVAALALFVNLGAGFLRKRLDR